MMIGNHSPEDLARVIAKRPGMYLGGTSYDHATGFLTGLASLASLSSAPVGEEAESDRGLSAENGSSLLTRTAELEREPNTKDREAIRALEPLLAEALEEVFSSNALRG